MVTFLLVINTARESPFTSDPLLFKIGLPYVSSNSLGWHVAKGTLELDLLDFTERMRKSPYG